MTGNIPLWIAEDVTWPVLWGLLAIGIFATVWLITRRFSFLVAALCCAGLVILAVLVEQRIVTDKEYLIDAVYQMASHIENNNAEGIVQFVRKDNRVFADRIRRTMKMYDFRTCRLLGFSETRVDPEGLSPRKAQFSFSVWASGSEAGSLDNFGSTTVAIELEFQKITDKWTVEAYGYVYPANAQRKTERVRD